MGSIAPNNNYKKVILKNISEEFGQTFSHEYWYSQFAKEFDVDIDKEILDESCNFEWIQKYNNSHIQFILTKPFEQVWAIFGAYEILDNTDYDNLYEFTKNLGCSKQGLVFFEIHRKAGHYETVSPLLQEIWDKDPEAVKLGFEFIFEHQLQMWERLNSSLME